MNAGLEGKIAMVSGASKGIGKAVALALAAEGVPLSLAARSENITGVSLAVDGGMTRTIF